ncbi:hypothetical protein KQY27_01665 [Methanobrevibacter sp. TMH8]|uniref:hypothetical protein n=1 Tax=Methanobrevibacter sp. TMH8 TaxID=2848611 RepID=UPI001CCDF39A|nr:hypothetical protein [Methanobrevibacter sp. TMH8]MBZ9570254.1 hypothetical protein [Methanobrevibacter sp. TMH8]
MPHIQFLENGYYLTSDFTYFIAPWDLLYLAGILLFIVGMSNITTKSDKYIKKSEK